MSQSEVIGHLTVRRGHKAQHGVGRLPPRAIGSGGTFSGINSYPEGPITLIK